MIKRLLGRARMLRTYFHPARHLHRSVPLFRLPQLLLLLLRLCTFLPQQVLAQQQQQQQQQQQLPQQSFCNYYNDTCLIDWQMDGTCDNAVTMNDCKDNDCWDCDMCSLWDDTSCQECTSQNCYWCPGDGLCKSQAVGSPYWDAIQSSRSIEFPMFYSNNRSMTSCPKESDWIKSSSNNPNSDDNACELYAQEHQVYQDPLYSVMSWSYDLIHVESVWMQNITGQGIHVRINDFGMDVNHEELKHRFDSTKSCSNFQSNIGATAFHGTAVASILAAEANNSECAVGIAPGVTLSACNFDQDGTELELIAMLEQQIDFGVDISLNSWGPETCTKWKDVRRIRHLQPVAVRQSTGDNIDDAKANNNPCIFDSTHPQSPCRICDDAMFAPDTDREDMSEACVSAIDNYCTFYYAQDAVACAEFLDYYVRCEYHTLPPAAHEVFLDQMLNGRNGKGIIYVFAGGNSNEAGATTNTDGFINSRFTIAVGGVDKHGYHASYSTTGSALHVVAPGGAVGSLRNNIVANAGGGCTEVVGGTSFSAPVVAGVVALMLEANPNLGWRDVQCILAETAQQVDPTDDSWTINNDGAGLPVSYKYGFGLVDAEASVNLSKSWMNIGPEQQLVLTSEPDLNLLIVDDKADAPPLVHSQYLTGASPNFRIESVVLYLGLQHASRGDLKITLTSPSGTESILHPAKRPENRQLPENETWKLMTVRNWYENPNGEWKLSISDERPGSRSNCADEPYEHLYRHRDGYWNVYNCLDAEKFVHCRNGRIRDQFADLISEYVDHERNNQTASQACCVCGGGTPVVDVDMLRSWTVIVYGHDKLMTEDESASSSSSGPSTAPTLVAETVTTIKTPDSSEMANNDTSIISDIDATLEATHESDVQEPDMELIAPTSSSALGDGSSEAATILSEASSYNGSRLWMPYYFYLLAVFLAIHVLVA